MWYNTNWSYRKRIVIVNPNQYYVPYAQVYLKIDYSDIVSYVSPNLVDVRFIDDEKVLQNGQYVSQQNELYHYFHYIDSTNHIAWVFIRVPNIDATSQKVIFMYFGNPNASLSTYRDPNQTFDYYINFANIASQQNANTILDNYVEIYDIRNNQQITFENNTLSQFVSLNTSTNTLDIASNVDIVVTPKNIKFSRMHQFLSLAQPQSSQGTLFGLTWFNQSDGFYVASESVLQTTNHLKLKHIANGVESDPITITYAPNTSIFNFVSLKLTSNKVIGSVDDQTSIQPIQSLSIQSMVNRTDSKFGLYNYGLTLSQPSNLYQPKYQINDLYYSQSNGYGIGVGLNGYAILFNSDGYSQLTTNVTANLNSVLVDGNNVVIVGEDGTVLFSSNQGSSFSKINVGVSYGLNKVTKIGSLYYIVGDQGTIITINPSNNNSVSVSPTTGNTNVDLYDIAGDGNSKLIAVGTGGNIIFSDNNGSTWSSKNIYTDNLTSIAYLGNNSFVIGTYNTILRSNDNGASFSQVPVSRFKGYLKKIQPLNNSNVVFGITDLGYVVYIYSINFVPYEVNLNTTIPGSSFSIVNPSQIWYYDGTNIQMKTLYSTTAQYHNLIAIAAYDKDITASILPMIENSDFPVNSLKLLQSAYLSDPSTKYIGTALFDTTDNKLKLWNGEDWIDTKLKVLTAEEQGIISNWANGETLGIGETRVVNISSEFDIDLQSIQIDQNTSISKPAVYNIKWLIYTMQTPPVIPISNVQATFSDLTKTINYVVDNNSPETMIPQYELKFTLGSAVANVNVSITDPSVLDSVVSINRREDFQDVTVTIRPKVNRDYSGIRNSKAVITISQYSYQSLVIDLNFSVEYVYYDTGTDHYEIDQNTYTILAVRKVKPVVIQTTVVVSNPVQVPSWWCACWWWLGNCCWDYAIEICPTTTDNNFDITKVCYDLARSNDSGQFVYNNVLSQAYTPTLGMPIVVNEGNKDGPFIFIDINLYYFGASNPKYITYEGTDDGGIGYGLVTYNGTNGFVNLGYARMIAQDRRYFRQNGQIIVTRII